LDVRNTLVGHTEEGGGWKSSGLEQLIQDAGPALKELTMSSLFRNFAVVPDYSLPLQDSSLCFVWGPSLVGLLAATTRTVHVILELDTAKDM
jgi:hypothetical protein